MAQNCTQPQSDAPDGIEPHGVVPLCKQWNQLTAEKRRLESELREINKQLETIEEPLIDALAQAGVNSISLDGSTLFMAREWYVKRKEGVSDYDMWSALHDADRDDCLMLSYQRLRALARECDEAGTSLPPEITAVIETGDRIRIRTRKAD